MASLSGEALRQADRGLPGGGPWLILETCYAPTHNSARAGLGYKRTLPCLCPRAKLLRDADLGRRRTRRKARKEVPAATRSKYTAPEARRNARAGERVDNPVIERAAADFTGGLCTIGEGVKIARDAVDNARTHEGIAARELAKRQCEHCPLRLKVCLPWITEQERPRGGWDGVYAGLDPWNRRGKQLVIEDGKAKVIPYVN